VPSIVRAAAGACHGCKRTAAIDIGGHVDRRRTADGYAADALSQLAVQRVHERLTDWLDTFARAIHGQTSLDEALALSDASLEIEAELERQGDARTAAIVRKLQDCLASLIAAHGCNAPGPGAAAHARRRMLCVSAEPAFAFPLQSMLAELDVDVELSAPDALPDDLMRFDGVVVHNDDAVLATIERQLRGLDPRPALVAALGGEATQERLRAYMTGADYVVRSDGGPLRLATRLAEILAARPEERSRVLLVDNDRSQLAMSEIVLRRYGLEPIVCDDPRKALGLVRTLRPDVVVLDLYMPEVDGLALTEQIVACPGAEHTSVVFLSGDTALDTKVSAIAAGSDDFLTKPVRPLHFAKAVLGHAKRAQSRRRAAFAGPRR
jgi:CheY-like chemotaxis protein